MQNHDINETEIVPYLIAEEVTNDPTKISLLVEKAETLYSKSAQFRKSLFRKGYDSRQVLETFMNHWLLAL